MIIVEKKNNEHHQSFKLGQISETGREKGKRDDGQSWWRADLVRKFEPAVEGKNW